MPAGYPNPPKLEGALQPKGNSLKVSWIKQDDGGSPILHYLVRYKPVSMKVKLKWFKSLKYKNFLVFLVFMIGNLGYLGFVGNC